MKHRFLLAASGALALIATTALTPAHGADSDFEADVGGGSAPIIVTTEVNSWDLRDLGQPDTNILTVNPVAVTMGKNGGNKAKQLVRQKVGSALVRGGYASIKGNRFGTPYAEGKAVVEDVTILTGLGAGSHIGTIESNCKWDRSGSTGSVILTDANGGQTTVPPNEYRELPGGAGYVVFNEQYTDRIYFRDAAGNFIRNPDGSYKVAEVLVVIGAHVKLIRSTELSDDIEPVDGQVVQDIYLGFTSCDPLALPNLSGLKQLTSAA